MAIPTSRAKDAARILLLPELCSGCGHCVQVCGDNNLEILNGKVQLTDAPLFGCIGCGHCMLICPNDAIRIDGRTLSVDDVFPLPEKETATDYNSLLHLLQRRRSIREFTKKEIPDELVNKIIEAAQTAPMGLPPSDVHLVVLRNRDKVREFSFDYCSFLKSMRWFVSDWFMTIMRPFWGKSNDEMFRGFVKPLFDTYIGSMEKGENLVTYDAPLAIYFYGSPYTDPADPIIAATYAMLAGESLGLGTCMLGGVHPLIQNGKKAKKFRENWGIKFPSREGLIVVFGYPAVKYKKGVRRTFADVKIIE